MSTIHRLSGWLFVIAIFLAGCESYNSNPGQVNGGFPGQATRSAGEAAPGQSVVGAGGSEVKTKVNDNPQPTQLPQGTIVPQSTLTRPDHPGSTDDTTEWRVYVDSPYQYQITYPPQYEYSLLEKADLAKIKPEPVSVVHFTVPSADAGLIVPPRFSISIFKIGAGTPVENWLKTNSLYLPESRWTIEEYKGVHFSGFKVNSSLYMAPGWFIYTVHGDYLYQLVPLGSEAEKMLDTFQFNS